MPAFNADNAFAVSFTALVEPWLRDHAANAATFDWAQLHFALASLQYLLSTDRTGVPPPAPAPPRQHVQCSWSDCTITSAEPDACLLNFAPRDTPPLWFCRAHHPKLDGLPAAGWTPPTAVRNLTALMTTAAWNKLTPDERPLLNRNIVTVASSSE